MDHIAMQTDALKAELAAFQSLAPDTPGKPHITFAGIWPVARQALVVLQGLVPASLRLIVSIVLSVGDTVAGPVVTPSPAAA